MLLIDDRVVLRANAPPEAEYLLFEIADIELRASEPGRVREHGYQTTVERARARLHALGITAELARDCAGTMHPVLSTAYARGPGARHVARYLGPLELFQTDIFDAATQTYHGVFIDLPALVADLAMPSAGIALQALFLATLLEAEADDTIVFLATDAWTRHRKPGERTHKRPNLGPTHALRSALGDLAGRNPEPVVHEQLPRPDVIAFLRARADAAPDEDARALYTSLERAIAVRQMPERGPLAERDLWAIETRLDTGNLENLLEAVEEVERLRGRTPGTTYLRARASLALHLEPPKLIAERVSALALSMTSFQELCLLAAEAWLDAGEPRRAMPYARDLVDAPGIDEGLLSRAKRILARAVGAAPDKHQTYADGIAASPMPASQRPVTIGSVPPVSAPDVNAPRAWPPAKSRIPTERGEPQRPSTSPGFGTAPRLPLHARSEASTLDAPIRPSAPAPPAQASMPPSMPPLPPVSPPQPRTSQAPPLPSSYTSAPSPRSTSSSAPSAPPATPSSPRAMPARSRAPDTATRSSRPPPLRQPVQGAGARPSARPSAQPALRPPPPPLDLELPPPPDPSASFTLDLPGPESALPPTQDAPRPAPSNPPQEGTASRRPGRSMGVVALETRAPPAYDPRAEPDSAETAAPSHSGRPPTEASERPTPLRPSSPVPPPPPPPPTPIPAPFEVDFAPASSEPVAVAHTHDRSRDTERRPSTSSAPPSTSLHGALLPPFRLENPPPLLPKAPLMPRLGGAADELAEHLPLPPGLGNESRSFDALPKSVLEARVAFTLLARELGLDYRLKRGIELRADVSGIEAMQSVLLESFPDHIIRTNEDAYELRRHGALLSEILARRLEAEWIDISPNEVGYWAMIVPPDTRVWPFGRVARLVEMGHRERDLVSFFFELQGRARGR